MCYIDIVNKTTEVIIMELPINKLITALLYFIKMAETYLLKFLNSASGSNLSWEQWERKFGITTTTSAPATEATD